MAQTITVRAAEKGFAPGTNIKAYKLSNWPKAQPPQPGVAPIGAADTANVPVASDGTAALPGLVDNTDYVYTDAAGSRYVRFGTPTSTGLPADDGLVVHKAGVETISGAKTIAPGSDITAFTITAPSAPAADQFLINDADGNQIFKIGAGGGFIGYKGGSLLYQLTNIAGAGNKAGVMFLYGTNGQGTGGLAWSIGVDTAAATPYRDLFIAKVNAGNSVTDEIYGSVDNGNGVVAWGVGFVPPPGDAKLSISPTDSDATQGGLRIRYVSTATGLPLKVAASADGRIRQAFNTKGGVMLSGDPNLQGAASGVQFLAASPAASGTVDRSIWLSAAGQITTDALLELPSASSEKVGLKIGTGGEASFLQSSWDGNQGLSLQHNSYWEGATRKWLTSHGSFGARAIEFSFGAAAGISFYADAAATTGGSTATLTERMRIGNQGYVSIGVTATSAGWGALNVRAPNTSSYGLIVMQLAAQTNPILAIDDTGGADIGGFDKNGYFWTSKVAAPNDGDLVAGQLMLWFDKTNGAAKLMIKAKENGGTVRTGSVALV